MRKQRNKMTAPGFRLWRSLGAGDDTSGRLAEKAVSPSQDTFNRPITRRRPESVLPASSPVSSLLQDQSSPRRGGCGVGTEAREKRGAPESPRGTHDRPGGQHGRTLVVGRNQS